MVYNLGGDGTVAPGLIVALYLLTVLVIGMAASGDPDNYLTFRYDP